MDTEIPEPTIEKPNARGPTFRATVRGTCANCGRLIRKGDECFWFDFPQRTKERAHLNCNTSMRPK